ncbi:TPA: helix-turn-helix transcriptional regulator [Escherichia coli]|uniref:helix-turn-helix transcriptional regulator n=1 Tax=Escherichia coli TaxID=562 RepID=UPI000FB6E434|nr:helix-turn-helix transcriptional regulator [Escherichia coli]KAB3181620.1 helix-turn-helix transcriptional regulator [Escherichia coli]KAB3193972.1 helix-turn-helix transcriptional regulator [Escherichia coli]MKZ60827.1 AraC family transcriptional regulator [Escherichia coli]HAV7556118.1 helix-turn-helix transcriptional regulator [Escherichia coli]
MLNTICHYILQWVEDNLDTGKNINDLVQTIGYSRKTVEMWFYKRYGITIGGYLFKRRMSRASVLLKLTHMSITEIATLLHYSSSQNFARTFKKFSKKSPTEYRNSKYWDITTMYPSLLYHFDIKHTRKIKMTNTFFYGKAYKINESFFYETEIKNKNRLQDLITKLFNSKHSDILVCIEKIDNATLYESRKGLINVSIKAGVTSKKKHRGVNVMHEGMYYCANFSGSWQEYYLFTFHFFITAISANKLSLKNNMYYIYFHNTVQDADDNVKCTFYAPQII